jgi:hypothetical protein
MVKNNCGADLRRDVALVGSEMARAFICVRTSKSCGGGSVDSVYKMASVHRRFGDKSTLGGRGGSAFEPP